MDALDRLRPDDPVVKWREDAEKRERARAQAQEELAREGQRDREARVSNGAWDAFAQRLAALEQSHSELHTDVAEIARATAEAINDLTDYRLELSRDQKDDLRELKTEVARLAAQLQEQKAAFQFAREKTDEHDPCDVPSFLPARRARN